MRHRTLLLLLLLLLLMATTRNAETPPNFVPKTLQNRAQKVPNVPSETLEKQYSFGQGFIVFDKFLYHCLYNET